VLASQKGAGFDQAALDEAARQGFAAGAFEESEEDGVAVVQEFYPDGFDGGVNEQLTDGSAVLFTRQ
jgi:hypothetical protein